MRGDVAKGSKNASSKIFTSLGMMILIWLGLWQVERLQWKNDILKKLEANQATPIKEIILKRVPKEKANYELISFSGTYDFENDFFLTPRSYDGKPGHHIITPLEIEGTNLVLLVNRGWSDSSENNAQAQKITDAMGIIRDDNEKNTFTPANSIDNKLLYYVDIKEIAAHLTQQPKYKKKSFMTFYVVYKNPMHVGKPVPYDMLQNISNNHLGYIIIWFSLAIALLLLYIYRHKS